MNRLKTIGLFAGIFAIAMGAISLSVTSESFFIAPTVPQSQVNLGMLGHVEYTLKDPSGNIKAYIQADNIVTEAGKDCVAQVMFDSAETVDACGSTTEFQYIAIGNFSAAGVPIVGASALEEGGSATNGCASSGGASPTPTNGGEMSRKLIDPTFLSTGTVTVVTLDTQSDPFDFDINNATVVMQSGIFNGASTQNVNGECTDTTTDDMFAYQDLNDDNGITVSDGDSLSVKWTITVG